MSWSWWALVGTLAAIGGAYVAQLVALELRRVDLRRRLDAIPLPRPEEWE